MCNKTSEFRARNFSNFSLLFFLFKEFQNQDLWHLCIPSVPTTTWMLKNTCQRKRVWPRCRFPNRILGGGTPVQVSDITYWKIFKSWELLPWRQELKNQLKWEVVATSCIIPNTSFTAKGMIPGDFCSPYKNEAQHY